MCGQTYMAAKAQNDKRSLFFLFPVLYFTGFGWVDLAQGEKIQKKQTSLRSLWRDASKEEREATSHMRGINRRQTLCGPSPEKQQNLERQGTRVTLKLKIAVCFFGFFLKKHTGLAALRPLMTNKIRVWRMDAKVPD